MRPPRPPVPVAPPASAEVRTSPAHPLSPSASASRSLARPLQQQQRRRRHSSMAAARSLRLGRGHLGLGRALTQKTWDNLEMRDTTLELEATLEADLKASSSFLN